MYCANNPVNYLDLNGLNAPYTFSGKEPDSETGFSCFGARYYDSDMNIWLSVDPMLDIYPHQTSYAYCSNNPVNRVDPNGMWDNPIFDWSGNLLGTDDKGIQGEAIIMNSKYFKQGMSHDEAMEKGMVRSNLPMVFHPDILNKIDDQTASYPSRPDWDGYLTLSEANEWYRNGNGQPLFVDASKIDLSPITTLDFSNGKKLITLISLPQNMLIEKQA